MPQQITPPDSHTKKSNNQRIIGLDIIRVMAILFVIAGHFFLNTPSHDAIFEGPSMFLQGMMRTLTMVNVPLFLILTGYLNLNKQISRKYYQGMVAVLLSYLIISIITIFFRELYGHEHLSPIKWILKITDFSAISYAWYIEMWIGLFLLTPFLNILWKNIATRHHKHILIATLYFLCAFPDMFNRYGVHLVPGYWELIYPCAFFFIGAYIREFQPACDTWRLLLFIITCCLVNPMFNLLFVTNHSMIQLVGDGNGIIGMPLAAAVFILIYRVNFNPRWLRSILTSISQVSLDMYLASYMFDIAVYSFFKDRYFENQGQFGIWFFVTVPIIFISSYIFAIVKQYIFQLAHLPTK